MYASDYRRIGRENLAGNWWMSVLVALVAALLGGAIGGSGPSFNIRIDGMDLSEFLTQHIRYYQQFRMVIAPFLTVLSGLSLAQFILGGVISLGHAQYLMDQHDRRNPDIKTLFSKFDQFGAGFLMRLLTILFTVLWTLLFIVPGIVASYSYAMAPFILAENPGMTASDAIRASKELMRGHKWSLFCLDLSFIGWALLCILTLGIGTLFLTPYMGASRAAFYRHITTSSEI